MLKNWNFLLLLIIFSAISITAQIADIKPDLTLDCPKEPVKAGEKIRVTATTKPDITGTSTFDWSISEGTIEGGQGTSTVEIQTPDKSSGTLSVALRVNTDSYFEPLDTSCQITIYETPQARLLDESDYIRYEGGFDGLHHSRYILDPIANELRNNPQGILYIVIYAKDKTAATARKITAAKKELDFVLFTFHKLPRDIVTVVDGGAGKELMRYYLVPPGAENPPIEEFPEPKPQNIVKADANACELNGYYLFHLGQELGNDPNLSIKIVFSPGKTETAAVNLKRQNIFLKTIEKRFPAPTVIIGEKTEGNGEVAIYLQKPGGEEEFFLLIYAIKNKSICLNCCEAEDMPKSLVTKKKGARKK